MVDQFDPDFWLYANEWSPDFKHKNTQEALWLEVQQNPTFFHSYLVTSRSRAGGPWLVQVWPTIGQGGNSPVILTDQVFL